MELAKSLEIDQAVGQFDRVLQLDARYIPGYFQKGSALLSAGRRDDARAALRTGIAAARPGEIGNKSPRSFLALPYDLKTLELTLARQLRDSGFD